VRSKNAEEDVGDALETIYELDLWKLRQIGGDFGRFISVYLNFIVNHPDDAYNYVVTLVSIILVIHVTHETEGVSKLKSLGEVLSTVSDLHTYLHANTGETRRKKRCSCYCENTRRTEKGIWP